MITVQLLGGACLRSGGSALLGPHGTARLMVTDIVNQGTYEIHLGRVLMRFPTPVDMGSGWRFEARAGGDLLVDQHGHEWRRVPTPEAVQRPER